MIAAGTELDFFATDLQHAPVDAQDSASILRAVQAVNADITPMVRLPDHSVYRIQQSLDIGYMGMIVPLVESASQAEALVRAAYYPPRGDRSFAGSIRAYLYGMEPGVANDRTILLPQIESAKGLENAEEIIAVDGVTGILLGPEDLSLSCGWRGLDLWSHPPFLEAVERVVSLCRQYGKVSSILTAASEEARNAGFQVIGFGGDIAMVRLDLVALVNERLNRLRKVP
jgi:2-dehydro-3-deoxyglucarate aldolase/4-hydroxy-2-oxoheptanedioate aldolase